MYLCYGSGRDRHLEIAYEWEPCPLCEALAREQLQYEEGSELREEIKRLRSEVQSLQGALDESRLHEV
jgi:NifB/MoaA-like Fe-S oxidoreductase